MTAPIEYLMSIKANINTNIVALKLVMRAIIREVYDLPCDADSLDHEENAYDFNHSPIKRSEKTISIKI